MGIDTHAPPKGESREIGAGTVETIITVTSIPTQAWNNPNNRWYRWSLHGTLDETGSGRNGKNHFAEFPFGYDFHECDG